MNRIIFLLLLFNWAITIECISQIPSSIHWPTNPDQAAARQSRPPSGLLTENRYTTIFIPKSATYILDIDSLYVDTLIMQDDSKLRFSIENSIVIAGNTFIGNHCEFDASGSDAAHGNQDQLDGDNGTDGKSITIVAVFNELRSLTIKTNGGKGGNGAKGRPGGGGQSGALGFNDGGRGENGGNGGNGGKGGNLKLLYGYSGFVPTFNNNGQHGIQLVFTGGQGGSFGSGGKGGPGGSSQSWNNGSSGGSSGKPGSYGVPGSSGKKGIDGKLILEKIID